MFVLVGVAGVVAVTASVAAVALTGGGTPAARDSSRQTGKTASPAPAPPPLAPIGLAAKAEPFSITLTWTQPATGAVVQIYQIYRDDALIGTVSAPATTFTDDSDVLPGKTYGYEVTSKGKTPEESDPASVTVKVPRPPLSAARLSGDFDVVLKPTSQYGFVSRFGRTTLGWNFRPRCDEGACSVVWKDLFFKGLKATLARKGTTYSGTDSGKFNSRCRSTTVITNVTVQFKVTKARVIDGEWRAVKLVGTFKQRDPPALGCVGSGIDWAVTATLLS